MKKVFPRRRAAARGNQFLNTGAACLASRVAWGVVPQFRERPFRPAGLEATLGRQSLVDLVPSRCQPKLKDLLDAKTPGEFSSTLDTEFFAADGLRACVSLTLSKCGPGPDFRGGFLVIGSDHSDLADLRH